MLAATTYEIVHACEQADAAHLAEQVRALGQLTPAIDPVALPFAGGVAALSVPRFGRKLNHVSGAGMEQPITPGMLSDLQDSYRARALDLELDLCPYVHRDSVRVVTRSGLQVNAYSNTFWCELTAMRSPLKAAASVQLQVQMSNEVHEDEFIRASVQGFLAQPQARSHELLTLLARCACVRKDTTLFAAKLAGRLAATAALALLPTRIGSVAMLYLASTQSEFRGHGLQTALLAQRLVRARELGARIAIVTARPGTSSARNAERAGLQLAYTKPTFGAR